MKRMTRVGIMVRQWWERGGSYLALMMRQALIRENQEVQVLSISTPRRPIGKEWETEDITFSKSIYANPGSWAKENDLDLVVFCGDMGLNQAKVLKGLGIKTLLLRMWEWFDPRDVEEANALYDSVLALTDCSFQYFNDLGLNRVAFVPWGVDLEVFKPDEHEGPTQFFHPAGFGGVGGRRATREARQAWAAANTADAAFTITTQRDGRDTMEGGLRILCRTMPRPVFATFYQVSDVAILPSKWEGLGLTFLEALGSGLAILTVDAPPMNSCVRNGWNGYLIKTVMRPSPRQIQVDQAIVDTTELAVKISLLAANPDLARWMGQNSRHLAETNYDWMKNGKIFVELCQNLVHGDQQVSGSSGVET